MTFPRASQALSRFTVLDLTRVRSGPTCVRQLADWGANVIKIETPAHLEKGEGPGGPRNNADFQNLHRNKRSITLDLKSPQGLAAFKRLVAKADVVVENFRPDVKDRLGIAYEDLKKVNKRIVLASISGFGQDGPYAGRPGFDQIAQGMGGLMSITGHAGGGPVRVGIAINDTSSGLLLANGIVLALLDRERTGEGQWVHTSLIEAQIYMLDFQAARYLIKGDVPGQEGNNHPTGTGTGMFQTSDGYINIAAAGDKVWTRFCEASGLADTLTDPDFNTPAARSQNRTALNQRIIEVVRKQTNAYWLAAMEKAAVPCGPINTIDKVFADPQVKHLGIATPIDHPKYGKQTVVGQPIHMSKYPQPEKLKHTPDCGEHTDEVLKGLGYDQAAIAGLRAKGAV